MECEVKKFFFIPTHGFNFSIDDRRQNPFHSSQQEYEIFLTRCLESKWTVAESCTTFLARIDEFALMIDTSKQPDSIEVYLDSQATTIWLPIVKALTVLDKYCTVDLGSVVHAMEVPTFIVGSMIAVRSCWNFVSNLNMRPFYTECLWQEGLVDVLTVRRYTNFTLQKRSASESLSSAAKRHRKNPQSSDSTQSDSEPFLAGLGSIDGLTPEIKQQASDFILLASKFTHHQASLSYYTMEMYSFEQTAALFESRQRPVPQILQNPTTEKVVYHLQDDAVEWKIRITLAWLSQEYSRVTKKAAVFDLLLLDEHLLIVAKPSQMVAFQIIMDYAKTEYSKDALQFPSTVLHLRNLTFVYLQQSDCNIVDLSLYAWLRSLAYHIGGRKLARRIVTPASRRFSAYRTFTGFLEHWADCYNDKNFLELVEALICFLDIDRAHQITRLGLEKLWEAFQETCPHSGDARDLQKILIRLFLDKTKETYSLANLGTSRATKHTLDWTDIYQQILYFFRLTPGLAREILREISCVEEKPTLPPVKHIREIASAKKHHQFPVFFQTLDSRQDHEHTSAKLRELGVEAVPERESHAYEDFFNLSQVTNGFVFSDLRDYFDDLAELKQYCNTAQLLESLITRITRMKKRRPRSTFCVPTYTREYRERIEQSFNFSVLMRPDANARIPILMDSDRLIYFEQAFIAFQFAHCDTLDVAHINHTSRNLMPHIHNILS